MTTSTTPTLYIVATPIGHLQDISLRALEILKTVSVIAAEDTRHSRPLLQHYGINTPLIALHEHNEREQSATLLTRLEQGQTMALISDAGTPLISDPGYHLVQQARARNIKVVPIPGASALIAALSVSGLPTDHFSFAGFLPAKAGPRLQVLQALKEVTHTLVFYEAPHRIVETITAMGEVFGADRTLVLARELTKNFETVHADTSANMLQWLQADPNQQRGEMVILVQGATLKQDEIDKQSHHILRILLTELPLKQAVKLTSDITGRKKNLLYDYALNLLQDN